MGLSIEPEEVTAILHAAEYARASLLDPQVSGLFYSKLQQPLQSASKDVGQLCKEAASAIDYLLRSGGLLRPRPRPAARGRLSCTTTRAVAVDAGYVDRLGHVVRLLHVIKP
jgi:hypothetical protein